MNRFCSFAVLCLGISSGVCAVPAHAEPAGVRAPVYAMFSKTKMVRFELRNDSSAPIELRVGDAVTTLAPGKTQSFKLAEGTRITANAASKNYAAGALLAEASSQMDGSTIVLH